MKRLFFWALLLLISVHASADRAAYWSCIDKFPVCDTSKLTPEEKSLFESQKERLGAFSGGQEKSANTSTKRTNANSQNATTNLPDWLSPTRREPQTVPRTAQDIQNLERNYNNCYAGYANCDRSLLTDQQARAAQSAALERNYNNCYAGYVNCDRSLLTDQQARAAQSAALERNYNNCYAGYVNCDRSLLTDSQKQTIASKYANPQDPPTRTCAENGSCYGDISTITGRPKTTHVQGYFRKDGTYVRGHYRSKR